MNKINIRYDKTSKCLELYDTENQQHYEANEVEDILGHGFIVDHEEHNITIEVPEQYAVQIKNPETSSYDVLAVCPANTVHIVFESIWNKNPNDTIRVIHDSWIYASYTPQDGAVIALEKS